LPTHSVKPNFHNSKRSLGCAKAFGAAFSAGAFSFDVSSNLCFLLCQKTHVATTPNAVLNTGSSAGSSGKIVETPMPKSPNSILSHI